MGSVILQVTIGTVFLYVTLSVVCSTITEGFARLLRRRSRFLRNSIQNLLRDHQDRLDDLMTHPLVTPDPKKQPDQVDARGFARALLEKVGATALQAGSLKGVLGPDATKHVNDLAAWFDTSMAQVTIWYREHIQWFTRGIAIFLVVLLNADTAMFVNRLWTDHALRATIVADAEERVRRGPPAEVSVADEAKAIRDKIRADLGPFPLGWESDELPEDATAWFVKIIGLLMTIIATTLGAPFWFDILRRMVGLRKPAATSKEPAAGTT